MSSGYGVMRELLSMSCLPFAAKVILFDASLFKSSMLSTISSFVEDGGIGEPAILDSGEDIMENASSYEFLLWAQMILTF